MPLVKLTLYGILIVLVEGDVIKFYIAFEINNDLRLQWSYPKIPFLQRDAYKFQ